LLGGWIKKAQKLGVLLEDFDRFSQIQEIIITLQWGGDYCKKGEGWSLGLDSTISFKNEKKTEAYLEFLRW